jgi:hypothetical protein
LIIEALEVETICRKFIEEGVRRWCQKFKIHVIKLRAKDVFNF